VSREQDAAPKREELGILLERLRVGSEIERENTLNDLFEHAKKSGNMEDWNRFAIALLTVGKLEEAVNIFEQLVQSHPEADTYRMNLAAAYRQVDQLEMCKYHLHYLSEHASTEEMRRLAREQMIEMERFLRKTEEETEEEMRYRQLQINSLRERIAFGQANADDYQRLGQFLILMQRAQRNNENFSLDETISTLEEGRKHFPDAVGILEYLVYCYLRQDPNARLEETLKKLEEVAPDSSMLRSVTNVDESTKQQYFQLMLRRAHELLNKTQSNDPELKKAAVQELGKMVAMFPSNSEYRLIYAIALGLVGQYTESLKQAELVANVTGEDYNAHFHLGQIFWMWGDPERGKQHLNLALQYATSEQERLDVIERITDLSGR